MPGDEGPGHAMCCGTESTVPAVLPPLRIVRNGARTFVQATLQRRERSFEAGVVSGIALVAPFQRVKGAPARRARPCLIVPAHTEAPCVIAVCHASRRHAQVHHERRRPVCRMSSPFALITGDVLHLERREDWRDAGLPSPRERWADGGEGSAKAPSPESQPTRLALALAPTLAHALT